MILSGLKYTFERLEQLPEQVKEEKVFTRFDGKYVYFQSELSCFSSFVPVEFVYK